MPDPNAELEQRIRERAYFLWQEEGCPEGRAEEFWDRARALEPGANPPGDDRHLAALELASIAPGDQQPKGDVKGGVLAYGNDTSPFRAASQRLPSGAGSPGRREPHWPSFLLALVALAVGTVWMARRFGTSRGSRGGGGRSIRWGWFREERRRVR
jgi:hypothetical protein